MPFAQSQAAEVFRVHFQNGGKTREFVQFHSAPAVLPMRDAFGLDVQFGGNRLRS